MMGRSRSREASRVAVRNVHSFLAKLVDVGNQNHGRFNRNSQQRQQSQNRRNAERSMRELQCYERAHGFGHNDAQGNRDWELEVSIQREQDHEDNHDRERAD